MSIFSKAFRAIASPFRQIAAGLGLYTPSSVKRERDAIQRMQAELEARTKRERLSAEASKEAETMKMKKLQARGQRTRKRRSVLFDEGESGLQETLG